jgi:hypothetical protein
VITREPWSSSLSQPRQVPAALSFRPPTQGAAKTFERIFDSFFPCFFLRASPPPPPSSASRFAGCPPINMRDLVQHRQLRDNWASMLVAAHQLRSAPPYPQGVSASTQICKEGPPTQRRHIRDSSRPITPSHPVGLDRQACHSPPKVVMQWSNLDAPRGVQGWPPSGASTSSLAAENGQNIGQKMINVWQGCDRTIRKRLNNCSNHSLLR